MQRLAASCSATKRSFVPAVGAMTRGLPWSLIPSVLLAGATFEISPNPQTGAGEACEMKRDQCARVADGALCDAWKKRVGETEVAWRFARAGNEEKNKLEFERAQEIYRQSGCGE